jgi:hypothetical protein
MGACRYGEESSCDARGKKKEGRTMIPVYPFYDCGGPRAAPARGDARPRRQGCAGQGGGCGTLPDDPLAGCTGFSVCGVDGRGSMLRAGVVARRVGEEVNGGKGRFTARGLGGGGARGGGGGKGAVAGGRAASCGGTPAGPSVCAPVPPPPYPCTTVTMARASCRPSPPRPTFPPFFVACTITETRTDAPPHSIERVALPRPLTWWGDWARTGAGMHRCNHNNTLCTCTASHDYRSAAAAAASSSVGRRRLRASMASAPSPSPSSVDRGDDDGTRAPSSPSEARLRAGAAVAAAAARVSKSCMSTRTTSGWQAHWRARRPMGSHCGSAKLTDSAQLKP